MLIKEIIPVYSENHMKQKKSELVIVKAGDI
jgi:hypothetical protein